MNSAQNLVMTLKNLSEIVILWIRLLKDYSHLTISSMIHCHCQNDVKEENVDSGVNDKQLAMKSNLEVKEKVEADILETRSRLIRSLESFEELLNKFINEMNIIHKSSYGEMVIQAFEKLPDNKKLACFIAFMDTVEKFQQE